MKITEKMLYENFLSDHDIRPIQNKIEKHIINFLITTPECKCCIADIINLRERRYVTIGDDLEIYLYNEVDYNGNGEYCLSDSFHLLWKVTLESDFPRELWRNIPGLLKLKSEYDHYFNNFWNSYIIFLHDLWSYGYLKTVADIPSSHIPQYTVPIATFEVNIDCNGLSQINIVDSKGGSGKIYFSEFYTFLAIYTEILEGYYEKFSK